MCGIAGTIGPVDPSTPSEMLERLRHRGPDDQGLARCGAINLVATRLSLIDAQRGEQPWREGHEVLVFNGEIYNHDSVRDLCSESYRSQCDTETLIRGWQAVGGQLWSQLDGMFAVAIAGRDTLVLARDPHGQKPLFLRRGPDGRSLCFASEVSALLAEPEVARHLDARALVEIGTFGFPLDDDSLFAGIESLPPGHELRVSIGSDGRLEYSLRDYREDGPQICDARSPLDALVEELPAVVRMHARADHPVGVYLSGGLDSGLLASLLASSSPEPIHTFTVADTPDHPDVKAARRLAELLGTTHHEIIVSPEQMEEAWPRAVVAQGLPSLPTIAELSAREVRKFVKAVLVGDGADELFSGYRCHRDARTTIASMAAAYNRLVRTKQVPRGTAGRIKRHFDEFVAARDPAEAIYRFFLEQRLPVNHLRRWDHGSMAYGLEVRLPLLSRSVTEIARRVGAREHIDQDRGKVLLREAARRLLPPPVYEFINSRAKVAAPSALARSRALINDKCSRWIPPDHRARHPLAEIAFDDVGLVSLDLLALQYLGFAGREHPGLEVSRLYPEHGAALERIWHDPSASGSAALGSSANIGDLR